MKLTPEKIAQLRLKAAALRTATTTTGDTDGNRTGQLETVGLASAILPQESAISASIGSEHSNLLQAPSISSITYNAQQREAIRLATSSKSFVLTGAAGTGKTTTTKGCIESIVSNSISLPLSADGHKHLTSGVPGIVCCAYTRRAVQNIRKVMPKDIADNCITIHKLLEYQPTFYEVVDEDTGLARRTMRFEPNRTRYNPLPVSIHTLIIDEASMVSVELHDLLLDAFSHDVNIIYIGDIQQLPPIFGSAILGYKLLELPVVELTHVYRQALESPIIRLAHRILSGEPIEFTSAKESATGKPHFPEEWNVPSKLKLHPWAKKLSADTACLTAAKFLTTAIAQSIYNPEEDIVLCPFNKSFGTTELNAQIANYLGKERGAMVYEIICGFNKKYLAVGDRVLYDKEDAVITGISYNPTYAGSLPQKESPTLDRWGHQQGEQHELRQQTADDIDAMLDAMGAISGDSEERKRSSSHQVKLLMSATDEEITVDSVGDVTKIDLGYVLTIHKSQGSEWRKVFLLTHHSHATMMQRELIYTACTRAREELYWICEPEQLTSAILNQRIEGNTIEAKAEFFKGKIAAKEKQNVTSA